MSRIKGHIRRPGLQHPHNRHHRLNRTRKQHRHPITGTHTPSDQHRSQPIRSLIQLAVGHSPTLTRQRHRPRRPRHLLGKQHRNRHHRTHRLSQHRPITPRLQPIPLNTIHHIHRRHPPPRISNHAIQNPPQPPHQHLNTNRIKHIGAEFHPAADPSGFTSRVPALGQSERQISAGGMRVDRQRADLQITKGNPVSGSSSCQLCQANITCTSG